MKSFTFNKTDRFYKLKRWRKAVLDSYNSKCSECGSYELVECHHVMPRDILPELEFEVSNGITLCFNCHAKKHDYLHKYRFERNRRLAHRA